MILLFIFIFVLWNYDFYLIRYLKMKFVLRLIDPKFPCLCFIILWIPFLRIVFFNFNYLYFLTLNFLNHIINTNIIPYYKWILFKVLPKKFFKKKMNNLLKSFRVFSHSTFLQKKSNRYGNKSSKESKDNIKFGMFLSILTSLKFSIIMY